jgi:hypothetical protein
MATSEQHFDLQGGRPAQSPATLKLPIGTSGKDHEPSNKRGTFTQVSKSIPPVRRQSVAVAALVPD